MTKREGILSQVATLLAAIGGVTVYRDRVSAFLKSESPAIHLTWAVDVPQENTLPYLDWTLQIKISVIVRTSTPSVSADSLVASVHAALMGSSVLRNLCIAFLPGPSDFKVVSADSDAGAVSMVYVAQYRTALADLTN